MQVITVIEHHNVDGYYNADLFEEGTPVEKLAWSYDMTVEAFEEKYEYTTETVTTFK